MINVIGLGYIGLPTALMMASHGVEVIGTDYNKELVATLNAGKTTFKEDGLDELFADAVKAGIKFTTEYQKTDMYIVSVPTPYDKFVRPVIEANGFTIGEDLNLVHAPERIIPGNMVYELLHNNRTNDSQLQFVLNRIYEIMEENGITDNRRVGLYGITYKENVDDVRESPTLQMLECQERHLARPLKSFDPFFTDKEIVKNQVLAIEE